VGFEWVGGVGVEFEFCGGLGWGGGGKWWEIVCDDDGGGGGVVCLRYGGGAPQSTTVRVGMSRAVRIGCKKLRFARGRLNKAIER